MIRCVILLCLLFNYSNAKSVSGIDTIRTGDVFDFSNPILPAKADLIFVNATNGKFGTIVQAMGNAKILSLGKGDYNQIKVAPVGGYENAIGSPSTDNVYCLITNEGYYVKFIIKELPDRPAYCELTWQYQDNGSRHFQLDEVIK